MYNLINGLYQKWQKLPEKLSEYRSQDLEKIISSNHTEEELKFMKRWALGHKLFLGFLGGSSYALGIQEIMHLYPEGLLALLGGFAAHNMYFRYSARILAANIKIRRDKGEKIDFNSWKMYF